MRRVHEVSAGGCTGTIYRDREWDEYRVKFSKDGVSLGEEHDYHTGDYADAESTALLVCKTLAGEALVPA